MNKERPPRQRCIFTGCDYPPDEPRCVIRSRVVTVTPGDNVTLECDVDAFPSPRRFSWSLNTTKGLHVVPKDEVSANFTFLLRISM